MLVGLCLLPPGPCWPAHPPSMLLNVKARAERATLHLRGGEQGRSLCCQLQAGEEKPWYCAAAQASQSLGARAPADCDGQWTAGAGATNSHAGSSQARRGNYRNLQWRSASLICPCTLLTCKGQKLSVVSIKGGKDTI